MTNMDPSSPEAWQQAEAIAKTAASGALHKFSDDLPFAFTTDSAEVIVHKGAVLTARGPAAAGAYLRDLGVVRGEGPANAEEILFVLQALDAMPPVKGVSAADYFKGPAKGDEADLMPVLDSDDSEATFTLSYLLGVQTHDEGGMKPVRGSLDPSPAKPDPNAPDVGAPAPNAKPGKTRKLLRCVLHIPAQGDAHWEIQELNWSMQ